MNREERNFTLGGRQSLLSRIQISLVAKAIQKQSPKPKLDFLCRAAQGDRDSKTPLWKMPLEQEGKGVFSSEFSDLLVNSQADLIIHSHKDLALETHPKTEIIPILKRADQRDILLFKEEALHKIKIPEKVILLTSSPRRSFLLKSFLKKALPKALAGLPLTFEPVRGNVSTRIKKLKLSKSHGLVLAKAALDRLFLSPADLFFDPRLITKEELEREQQEMRKILKEEYVFMVFPLSHCPNAPAQASLAAEIRKDDQKARELALSLEDPVNTRTSLEERKQLSSFGGGCHQKIGIACIEREYGKIQYLGGEDEKGKDLWEKNFYPRDGGYKAKDKTLEKIWPRPKEALEIRIKRVSLAASLPDSPPQYAWVSRNEAWPEKWKIRGGKETIIWTSGVQSLFSLAKRGLWVHGSADGLGEEEPGIESLLGETDRKIEFVKLTHQKRIVASRWNTLSTYEIELNGKIAGIAERAHFFWRSATQFEWISKAYPEILEAQHACGPGLTYSYIRKKVLSPVRIYPDHDTWLRDISA